jgi:hypothetical protein
MSELIAALMHANLHDVFGERDDQRRIEEITRTYTDDVAFIDPDGPVWGHDAVNQKARELLERAPGFVLAADGPLYSGRETGCLAWRFGPEGLAPVARGVDIASVKDGRIASIRTLLAD